MAKSKCRILLVLLIALSVLCFTISSANYFAFANNETYSLTIDSSKFDFVENKTSSLDASKTGLELKSVISGDAADGTGIMFTNIFHGNFEMDFRVLSALSYKSKLDITGGDYYTHYPTGLPYDTSNLLNDNFNPYTDVKKMSFVFTSVIDSSKSFSVSIKSGFSGYAESLDFRTEISGDSLDVYGIKGYGIKNNQIFDPDNRGYEGTVIYNSTFCNYNGYVGGAGNSTVVGFDLSTMQTYTKNGDEVLVIRTLSNNNAVIESYRTYYASLLASDFNDGYTVKIVFDDVTSNTTVGTDDATKYGNLNRGYEIITTPYDRYVDMIIYSLNGKDMTSESDNYNLTTTKSNRQLSSFIDYNQQEVQISYRKTALVNKRGSQEQIELDGGRKGVLLTSLKSGNFAEGDGFAFSDTMSGPFSIDFRVFSQKTYDGTMAGGSFDQDSLNPYQDLKKLEFIFESTTGKSFTVIVDGALPYKNNTTMMSVKTGNMSVSRGLSYDVGGFNGTPDLSETYKTALHGTSFSNASWGVYDEWLDNGGICNSFEFDVDKMKVYATALDTNFKTVKVLVLDLSNPEHVGAENVLKTSDFKKYNVSVKFADLTDNQTQVDGNTYDRKANMIIYSLNGVSFDDSTGYVCKSFDAKPYLYLSSDYASVGDTVDLTPYIYDGVDGQTKYDGKLYYSISNGQKTELIKNALGNYLLTPTHSGKVSVYIDSYQPSTGINITNVVLNFYIYKESKIALKDGLMDRYDIGSTPRPSVSLDDVVVEHDADIEVEMGILYIETPTGKRFENYLTVYNLEGVYKVCYFIRDHIVGEKTVIREINVGYFTGPTISVNEFNNISVGQTIDLTPVSVMAQDGTEGSCSVKVYFDNQVVSTAFNFTPEKVGQYRIVYTATDRHGLSNEKTIEFTVESAQSTNKGGMGCVGSIGTVECGGFAAVCAVVSVLVFKKKRAKK